MAPGAVSDVDQALLNRAASLLDLVGRYAGADCGVMAVLALRATELLAGAGASVNAVRMQLSAGDAHAAVRQALAALGRLSPTVFDQAAVIEATEAAQLAFAAG